MTDKEIVSLYWERSEEAIRQTQRKYDAYLTKTALNILSDPEDSGEAVNDTYLAAWNSMPENRPQFLSTYLGKITRQIAIDLFRKRNSKKRRASEYALSLSELEEICSDRDSPAEKLETKLLDEAVNRFLRTLSREEQAAFIGRYYFFDPLKEVAKYGGMTEAKAKSMLYRTRQKLKVYLAKEGLIG